MRLLLVAAAILTLFSPNALPASAQEQCSRDELRIRGTAVAVDLCAAAAPVAAGSVVTMRLTTTYASGGHSFTHASDVRFISGAGPARALESVDLQPVGVTGILHLTLLYAGNLVTIEHAMLTPGALTIR